MFDLRGTWQARALASTKDNLNAVVLSVLAHNYDEQMPVLLALVWPDFIPGRTRLDRAIYCSAARIDKAGRVVADMVTRSGLKEKDSVVFTSEIQMRGVFRRLADMMKLSDRDRIEMFHAVQNWVVADRRLDPAMDPKDPDAKRLVFH
jgi:putative ubiquitin-RnfH superfamily antitoxin RatB of RatAB toxin-antitoxin module